MTDTHVDNVNESIIVENGESMIIDDNPRIANEKNNRTIIRSKTKIFVPMNNELVFVGKLSSK